MKRCLVVLFSVRRLEDSGKAGSAKHRVNNESVRLRPCEAGTQPCSILFYLNFAVMQRRTMLKWGGFTAGVGLFTPSKILAQMEENYEFEQRQVEAIKSDPTLSDEEFWRMIRMAYTSSPNIVNLNNGGVAPSPKVVQEAVEFYQRLCNEAPSYYMWRILDQGREPLRKRMASIAGCSEEELAFHRNSSEALETIIFGLRLKAGDEVILTKQDYPNMINAWKQRAHRDGIELKWLNFEFPIEDDEMIVKQFQNAISPKTKIIHITHMINWVGQVLPARKIADVAHARGIEVVLDAAHSFAHIPYKIRDLDCDYFGTSLHKWLSAPIGTGLLYVKKEKIKQLYPLLAGGDAESSDIRKFENLGTRSFALEQAIGQAIDFFDLIGAERKFDRLCSLKERWVNQVKSHPKVKIHSPQNRNYTGAIGNVSIEGSSPESLADFLFNEYKIHTVAINWENIHGVRITPNVYSSMQEMDLLASALLKFCNKS
ncbi:MAG TPA: aminotransferase class V-fold PLP-dependent enzyme [Saprospiraceae bacterium]|nr:aminotransferase class V-fold PLP-dependent enzyme [Saprospiraceae bacterium]